MYSIVLMMALGGGTEVPSAPAPERVGFPGQQLNRCFHRCGGGCGCYCGGCYGCYGGYSYGCSGCWGGYGYGGCYCWGGCCGGYGSYGGWGGMGYVSVPSYSVATPYATSYYQPSQPAVVSYSYPSMPTSAVASYSYPSVPANGTYYTAANGSRNGYAPANGVSRSEPLPVPSRNGGNGVQAPAKIVVTVPADAKLTFGNQLTRSTSTTRTFLSPPLEPGVNYFYTLKAEIARADGKIIEEKRISVRAGAEVEVSFNLGANGGAIVRR